jgi:hypothetical protein
MKIENSFGSIGARPQRITDDPQRADRSIRQPEANAGAGLIINPVVYAEFCFGSPSVEFVDDVVSASSCRYGDEKQQDSWAMAG